MKYKNIKEEELKKKLQKYRQKMLDTYKNREAAINKINETNDNSSKNELYKQYVCDIFGHDPERNIYGAIIENDGLCKCRLCHQTYAYEKSKTK